MMTNTYLSRENIILKELKESPSFAREYLAEAQQEGDIEVTIMAIREILTAYRLVKTMADSIEISRTSIYKWLNFESEPYAETLQKSVNFLNDYLLKKEVENYLFKEEFECSLKADNMATWNSSFGFDNLSINKNKPLAA